MNPPLVEAMLAVLADESARNALHVALLTEPVWVPAIGLTVSRRTSVQIGGAEAGFAAPLVESVPLGIAVLPVFPAEAVLVEGGRDRGWWGDEGALWRKFEGGALFRLLAGHPGALMVIDVARSVRLDAGELASLASGVTSVDERAQLQALLDAGRGREVARRIAARPVYTLGHPRGGMLMFQRELPIFLHLADAERFAAKIAMQTGGQTQHGLVAAAELFQRAIQGKLSLLIDPGPSALRLRWEEMRI